MKRVLRFFGVFCLLGMCVLLTCNIALAQTEIEVALPVPIVRLPNYYAKITHAGAVELGIYDLNEDPTGFQCPLFVRADTFLTIVNPAESLSMPCTYAGATAASLTLVPPRWAYTCVGWVVLFDSDGNIIGRVRFKVPPKGNRSISLAKIIILSGKAEKYLGRVRKYTYDIVWYFPYVNKWLSSQDCIIYRPPLIPVSVEVKEIIFHYPYCIQSIKADETDRVEKLINDVNIVKTWSETILDRSNILYPLQRLITVEEIDTLNYKIDTIQNAVGAISPAN